MFTNEQLGILNEGHKCSPFFSFYRILYVLYTPSSNSPHIHCPSVITPLYACHLPCQGPFFLSKHFLMCGLPLEDLPGPILVEKAHFSPPVPKTCQQLLSLVWRFMPNSLLHAKDFAGLGLHTSCVCCHNHCASICALVLLCSQDIVSF